MIPADWWIRFRSRKQVKLAIDWGFAQHCFELVQGKLDDNFIEESFPSSWNQFTVAMKLADTGKTSRKRHGLDRTHVSECLGIAVVLGIPTCDLLPEPTTWIANGVSRLCESMVPSPSENEIQWFAAYSLAHYEQCTERGKWPKDLEVDEKCLKSVADRLEVEEEPIRQVVERVAPYLHELLAEATP